MRDWPILLTSSACLLCAAVRYIAANGTDHMVAVLLSLGSAAFGAWLYSQGKKDDD